MREHNRIVGELAKINPHWNDEQLFQNGRRIMSAEFQHLAYNEFLPRILGWNAIQLYDLKVLTEGYYNGDFIYKQSLNRPIIERDHLTNRLRCYLQSYHFHRVF